MASLIENLVSVLNKENDSYVDLIALSEKKTPVIVKGDIAALQQITEEEQLVLDTIASLEKKREEHMADIANVINKDVETLKIDVLIKLLGRSPKDQKALQEVYDKLQVTMPKMRQLNERNQSLLGTALEMVEFDLQLIQNARKAPETANYNKGAYNTGSPLPGGSFGSFDAKQ